MHPHHCARVQLCRLAFQLYLGHVQKLKSDSLRIAAASSIRDHSELISTLPMAKAIEEAERCFGSQHCEAAFVTQLKSAQKAAITNFFNINLTSNAK